ncbi:GL17478 [Drosophila persimilis]|uniref:GL17478 n=1 Tax=Drosophila persimilis TaxID=7234 RepID=B4GH77_DROPE|nr:GL17478 [Drosophila persimilis]
MGVTWALALPVQTSTPVPNIKVEPVTDGRSLATSEASQSERTSESSSTSLSHSETFTSERAPEIVTSEAAISTAFPLEASTTEKSIAKPRTNSQGEDSKLDSTTEQVSKEPTDEVQCVAAWDKFLIDFGGRYHSEIEKEKRRNVFCDNWRLIRKHNKLFEQHMVPYEMDVNQFSDLTFEEWRLKQMPRPGVMRAPEIVSSEEAISGAIPLEASTTEKSIAKQRSQEEDSKVDSTTEVSEEANDQVLCRITWEKFLIDFGGHYHSEIEKEKRRNVFCDNWRSIKKHNKLFEQHMVPYEMDINQFSDLTFEEWKTKQMPRPVVMDRDF